MRFENFDAAAVGRTGKRKRTAVKWPTFGAFKSAISAIRPGTWSAYESTLEWAY